MCCNNNWSNWNNYGNRMGYTGCFSAYMPVTVSYQVSPNGSLFSGGSNYSNNGTDFGPFSGDNNGYNNGYNNNGRNCCGRNRSGCCCG